MKISPLRNDYGVLIEPSLASERLADLNPEQIKEAFKESGIVLFRGFDINIKGFEEFTLAFAEKMVGNREVHSEPTDFYYRENVSGDSLTATVNVHKGPIGWHSEDCHLPTGPDILFLYCERPPVRGGATLLTDGVELFGQCGDTIRDFLTTHRSRHNWTLPVSDVARFLGITPDKIEEASHHLSRKLVGGQTLQVDVREETVHMKYTVPLARKPRWSNQKAFCNRLLLDRVVLAKRMRVDEQSTIEPTPGDNFNDMLRVLNNLAYLNAYHLHWQTSDLVMFDNTRVMHARAPIQDDERRILTRGCIANF